MKYAPDILLRRRCDLGLCIDERDYLREMRRLKIKSPNAFVTAGKSATMHWFDHKRGGDDLAIVCIDMMRLRKCPGTAIAALLVHEAVHVFQSIRESMGEEHPSSEFEAYSIQRISQDLMFMYQQSMKKVKRRSS
ncbi:hypothetical protein [Burkholderia mayonis]|uniref:Uncharacterized protein n=1 Tax=Burkholderia mayonis TaxID=1385591 RepID=A0A1B4G335_9BURK|nr:hypothetical protein [Burkholderia mayonis]AOJ10349.1 hypothetical protein WS71_24375 [Burkholderia mayonis]KVE53669.1 hypothetical protein WS71_06395 [Burkholderia mayonis]